MKVASIWFIFTVYLLFGLRVTGLSKAFVRRQYNRAVQDDAGYFTYAKDDYLEFVFDNHLSDIYDGWDRKSVPQLVKDVHDIKEQRQRFLELWKK